MSWSEPDVTIGLKEKQDKLTTLYNTQRGNLRDTRKCISQINNLKQVQNSSSTDTEGKTTITYKNPENPSGGTMADDYRNEQIPKLIDNIEAYLAKFESD